MYMKIYFFINITAPTENYTLSYTTLFRSLQPRRAAGGVDPAGWLANRSAADRKSTRLNSSHPSISYAVFCLKKKNIQHTLPNFVTIMLLRNIINSILNISIYNINKQSIVV